MWIGMTLAAVILVGGLVEALVSKEKKKK